MEGSTIIFYLLAALTLVSGVLAVSTRQIFRAAIFLVSYAETITNWLAAHTRKPL